MPLIDFDEKKLSTYAKEILGAHNGIPGVQPKLSIWLEENKENIRFKILDGLIFRGHAYEPKIAQLRF